MQLCYLDRATYRRKDAHDVLADLHRRFGEFYLLPEGGSNALGVQGCAELTNELDLNFDVVCCAVGTGGTIAGVASELSPGQRALGFSTLKGGSFLVSDVERLQREAFGLVGTNWSIECDYHFGGFGKSTPKLVSFISEFERRHRLKLDWVYVGKMLYGVLDLAARGSFPAGTVLVAIVTGPATD